MRFPQAAYVCVVLGLSGCAGVPPVGSDAIRPTKLREPVFVVVPANRTSYEDDYATEVERQLLSGGLRVAVRPTFKAVRIETQGTESQAAAVINSSSLGDGSGAASTEGQDRVVESFLQMTDTKASYRINTYARDRTIELVDLPTQQVLFVLTSTQNLEAYLVGKGSSSTTLLEALQAVGFPVARGSESKGGLVVTGGQPSPIFTVIPSSDFLSDTSYALSIEEMLIRLGLNIVRPPAPHYREQSAAMTKAAANNLPGEFSTKTASARKIESFWEFEDTAANVILETNSSGNGVKIIDKASKEVRSVVTIRSSGLLDLRDALVAIGIPVAFEPPPPPPPPPKPSGKPKRKK